MRTTFPFKAGDIFFVGGRGWLNAVINYFQAMWSKDGVTRYSHVGIIMDDRGSTFETTAWRTGVQSMSENYAGSEIAVLRWADMTQRRAAEGQFYVRDQEGRIYPYWRLLAHIFRVHGVITGRAMECSVLVANYLLGAKVPLAESNLWLYDVEKLYDELVASPKWRVIFAGSLREAGYIVG